MLCTCLRGYIFYIEYDLTAISSQGVNELGRGDKMVVLGGYRDAGAKEEVFLFQHLHRLHGALEDSLASALVSAHSCTFNADDGYHVEMVLQELHVGRTDERTIGEDGEYHVFHLGNLL